jgi:RimJ/RimL family protein N-acetyltransferase
MPPRRIPSDRLLLRCWEPGDAPLLDRALKISWSELQKWIPWVFEEPEDLPALANRLRRYEGDFGEGRNALYAVMDPAESEVWGGAGLYRRVGPRALEIGYWVRTDLEGRGIATEAAALLTHAGLGLPGIDRMEIRCDPDHTASAAVPRKLGYHLREVLRQEASESSSAERDTMVFEMSARQFRALAASGASELKGRSRRTSHRREREGEGP